MLQELKRLLSLYYNKLYNYILAAPPGSLQLTGVLGLAALAFAYHQLRRGDAPNSGASAGQRRQQAQQQATGLFGGSAGAAGAAAGGRLAPGSSAAASAAAKPGADAAGGSSSSSGRQQELSGDALSIERRVRSRLSGVRKVTISALGPLTEEYSASDLQEGANLRSEAAGLLRELCACAETYVITQVQDDVGQAAVTGALEAAGLVGTQPGQLKPHRLLFCSTLDGKVSVVRQIEPDLHIDGTAKTIEDLKRFMPQLLHVVQPGSAAAAQGSPNVASCSSLQAFFS